MNTYDFCIIGHIKIDYLLTANNDLHEHLLGGGAIYAAIGARLWSNSVGILSAIGDDFPQGLLDQLDLWDIQTKDIIRRGSCKTEHLFIAYSQTTKRADVKATSMYAQLGKAIPKALLDMDPDSGNEKTRTSYSVSPDDLPTSITDCRGIHLAGITANPAILLGHYLNQFRQPIISYDPHSELMKRDHEKDLRLALHDIDLFLPSERQCLEFFRPERPSLQEMAETFASMGPSVVVIKRGERGQALFDANTQSHWHIPAYPVRPVDVTGAGHVYCGGFAAAYGRHKDPVEAAISASVAASIAVEGVGISYPMEAMPGLAEARRDRLAEDVQQA